MTPRQIFEVVKKAVEPVRRLVQLTVSQCLLASVDDSKGIQQVKVSLLAGEVQEMERLQNYGFTSVPLPGAEGVSVFIGGNREHGVCINMDSREFRPSGLSAGTVCIYDALGSKVTLSNDGTVQVDGITVKVAGKLAVELGSGSQEKILNGETFQANYNLHTHTLFGIPTTPVNVPSTPLDLSQVVTAAKLPSA